MLDEVTILPASDILFSDEEKLNCTEKLYKNLEKDKESWQINLGVVVAAIVCPVVNTGIFLLGCVIFFLPTIRAWGADAGYENVGAYMLYGFVGGNFLFELLFNLILSPVIVQIIRIGQRSVRK